MATILVVDDEPQIADIAADYLRRAGFTVVTTGRGDTALEIAQSARLALIVLDLRLPGMDGLDVARRLRRDSDVPIIMLTARVEESDRLRGLEVGADDYITKPFSPRELVARVKAVLRRTQVGADGGDTIPLGDIFLDLSRQQAYRGGAALDLTTTEFQLLLTLSRQPGRVFTRTALLDAVGGGEGETFDRAIDAHVKNIRRKIERDPRHPSLVLTVYGAGYKAVER